MKEILVSLNAIILYWSMINFQKTLPESNISPPKGPV